MSEPMSATAVLRDWLLALHDPTGRPLVHPHWLDDPEWVCGLGEWLGAPRALVEQAGHEAALALYGRTYATTTVRRPEPQRNHAITTWRTWREG